MPAAAAALSFFALRSLNCSSSPAMPRGSSRTMPITTRPISSSQCGVSAAKPACRPSKAKAPRIAPNRLPMPPRMTITSTWADSSQPTWLGLTKPYWVADSMPA
ncbi:hypothetical protein D3C77_662450 [compost metagenome]